MPTYRRDRTPPVTTLTVTGPATGPLTLTLKATDAGGSGVKATYYRKNGATSWAGYRGPFTVTAVGPHLIEWYSVDRAGNREAVKAQTVTVEAVVPPPPPPDPPPPTNVITLPAGTHAQRDWPDGAVVQGAGIGATILSGKLLFGSGQTFSDLTIDGAGRAALKNKADASGTAFRRVRTRGGGSGSGIDSPTVYLGQSANCDNLLFEDCDFERPVGSDASGGSCRNVFTVQTINSPTCIVHDITWRRCRFGVANAAGQTGSPRMGLECVISSNPAGRIYNLHLDGCVIETTDSECLDFSDLPGSRMTGVVVENCTLKGGGLGTFLPVGVVFEIPPGFVFRNNTVLRSKTRCLQTTTRSDAAYPYTPGVVISGNLFDFTVDNGVTPASDYTIILRKLDGFQFTGNTIRLGYGVPAAVGIRDSRNGTVTGNVAQLGGRPFAVEYDGSTGNTITGNTVS